jgi:hypothetical protein
VYNSGIMKALRLQAALAAISALLALAPSGASAQPVTVGGILSPPIPGPGNGSLFPTPIPPQVRGSRDGFHRGLRHDFPGTVFITEEPDVVHDVYVVHDEPAAAPEPSPPPPAPREPYVIGRTYDALPGGCLKMITGGASYFHCTEGWYREVGSQYQAVEMP